MQPWELFYLLLKILQAAESYKKGIVFFLNFVQILFSLLDLLMALHRWNKWTIQWLFLSAYLTMGHLNDDVILAFLFFVYLSKLLFGRLLLILLCECFSKLLWMFLFFSKVFFLFIFKMIRIFRQLLDRILKLKLLFGLIEHHPRISQEWDLQLVENVPLLNVRLVFTCCVKYGFNAFNGLGWYIAKVIHFLSLTLWLHV